MSLVNILNIEVLNNPGPFLSNYQIEITFECIGELQEDLEFSLIYCGSSEDSKLDQELDSLLVGPVPIGINKFILETKPPNVQQLNPADVMDYTGMYLKCIYRDKEFLRCAFLVKAQYDNEQMNAEPQQHIIYERLLRLVSDKPKVTRFPIPWDSLEEDMPPPQPDVDQQPALNLDDLLDGSDNDDDENDDDDKMEE